MFSLIIAQGNLKPEMSGIVAGIAGTAAKLKHGTGPGDLPVVSIESDTG